MAKKKVYYSAEGNVLGNMWGGGQGFYPARKYNNFKKLSELKSTIRKDFNSGALDSGMGFESLEGALMHITTFTEVDMKMGGKMKTFRNQTTKKFKLGKFSEAKFMKALGH